MTVSSATNRVSFSGNASTTVFAYNFKIFASSDLTVILRAATGSETTQTLTTHYSVSGVGVASGGNVTFGSAPASGVTVVILREQPLTQGLDLVANDPFPSASVEDSLDKLTFMVQQHDEELGRVIKASKTNTISGAEFTVSAANRASKVFAFDSSGNLAVTQELGEFTGNWAASTVYALRDIIKDTNNNNIYICITAHTSSGAVPISSNTDAAKWGLLVNAAAATTSATAAATSATASASSATAAASSATAGASSATAAASSATAAASSATAGASSATSAASSLSSFTGQYATGSSDPSSNLNTGDLFFNSSTNLMKVYNGSAWVALTPSSSAQTNIDALAASAVIADMALLGTSAVVADLAILGTSDVVADLAILATSDVVTDMNVLGTSDVVTDMNVLGTSANVTAMNTLGTSANVTAMSNVSGAVANVNTVASNISSVNNFAAVYRIASSDPGSSLTEGDLVFNTTSDKVRVYNGSAWQDVAPVATSIAASQISDVTSTATELNQLDAITRGSILVGNASGVTARLTKGTAGQVLTSDGTDIAYADAGGGLTLLGTTTISDDTSITIGSIPSTATNIWVNMLCRTDSGNVKLTDVKLGTSAGIDGSNYNTFDIADQDSTASSTGHITSRLFPGSTVTNMNSPGFGQICIQRQDIGGSTYEYSAFGRFDGGSSGARKMHIVGSLADLGGVLTQIEFTFTAAINDGFISIHYS